MKEEVTYKSNDGITNIHACIWVPNGEIKAIIQVIHGMADTIERYNTLAASLTKRGILVCGNDQLGHGKSITKESNLGYFALENSENILIEDTYTLTKIIQNRYPNVPYFLLGNSMGSFIARNYLTTHAEDLTGCILIGTSYKNSIIMNILLAISWISQLYHHGWYYRSPLLYKITIDSLKRNFEEKKENPFCWLTTNKEKVKEYTENPLCNFKFTCNGYKTLFNLIKTSCSKKYAKQINKDLPLLIMSGKDDPVNNFAKENYKVEKFYKESGLTQVKLKIYNDMRHDLINETNNVLPITDIINFVENNAK